MNSALVVFSAGIANALTTFLEYILFYGKESYKEAQKELDYLKEHRAETQKELEKLQEKYGRDADKKKGGVDMDKKKITKLTSKLRDIDSKLNKNTMDQTSLKGASFAVVGVINFLTFTIMRSAFAGTVVGHLPFTPFSLVALLTHMGLAGNDMTEVSYSFIFLLSTTMIRGLIQKYFKFTPDTPNPVDYDEMKKQIPSLDQPALFSTTPAPKTE